MQAGVSVVRVWAGLGRFSQAKSLIYQGIFGGFFNILLGGFQGG